VSVPTQVEGPLDHVLRIEPPWREQKLTECGRYVADVDAVVSREELAAKFARLGRMRAAFSTCMTCYERSRYRARGWELDCIPIMHRDTAAGPRGHLEDVRLDLLALTALWRAHPEEFAAIRESLADGTDLDRAREKRAASRRRLL